MKTETLRECEPVKPLSPIFTEGAFSRLDESDDSLFYRNDRFVNHLDTVALKTVERLIGELIIEKNPAILDLMSGWDSHIPEAIRPSRVTGLGLNERELKDNKGLTDFVIHDLNVDSKLPFPEGSFDAVINTVSVDYMTRPLEVFGEVGRILKPGGLFLVIFSNRMFPEKAVKVWKASSDEERILLVEEFFERAGLFDRPGFFRSIGKPRPKDDKYAHMGIPSDPVYAVYADKKGGDPNRAKRPDVCMHYGEKSSEGDLAERKREISRTLCCPHCGERMKKWAVPHNPFAYTWDNDFMYICFNDACPYYVRGWDVMSRGGNQGVSYRLMYNPDKDCCSPIPVQTPKSLREGIIK